MSLSRPHSDTKYVNMWARAQISWGTLILYVKSDNQSCGQIFFYFCFETLIWHINIKFAQNNWQFIHFAIVNRAWDPRQSDKCKFCEKLLDINIYISKNRAGVRKPRSGTPQIRTVGNNCNFVFGAVTFFFASAITHTCQPSILGAISNFYDFNFRWLLPAALDHPCKCMRKRKKNDR